LFETVHELQPDVIEPPIKSAAALTGYAPLGVTERYAEYDPNYLKEATAAIEQFFRPVSAQSKSENWCRARGLNPRPSVYKTAALPLS
jgi:hypothetical protein